MPFLRIKSFSLLVDFYLYGTFWWQFLHQKTPDVAAGGGTLHVLDTGEFEWTKSPQIS